MKFSSIRGVVIFATGAICGTVGAGIAYTRPPISTEEFQARGTMSLANVAYLGQYVYKTDKSHVWIETNPKGQCVPVPPPPNYPYGAVNPHDLAAGFAALNAMENGYLMGDTNLVSDVGKC